VVAVACEYARPQRALSQAVALRRLSALTARLSLALLPDSQVPVERRRAARWARAALAGAASWGARVAFEAAPLLGTRLLDDEFAVLMRTRVGLPVLPQGVPVMCHATCRQYAAGVRRALPHAVDFHARTCAVGFGRIAAHDACMHAFARVVRGWGIATAVNALHGAGKARADAELLVGGQRVLVDFTSCDVGTVYDRAAHRGIAARDALEAKLKKYAGEIAQPGTRVLIYAVDSFGAWPPAPSEMEAQLRWLVATAARDVGGHEEDMQKELYEAVQVAFVRGLSLRYALAGLASGVSGWFPRVTSEPAAYARLAYVRECAARRVGGRVAA
jgi:hypothetical protein